MIPMAVNDDKSRDEHRGGGKGRSGGEGQERGHKLLTSRKRRGVRAK